MELTERQAAVLDFMVERHRAGWCYPSIRELCGQFGFKSPNAATGHLRALTRKGFIERPRRKEKMFRVLKDSKGNVYPAEAKA